MNDEDSLENILELKSAIVQVITCIDKYKPNDRSPLDRHYAIVLTEIEKIYAYVSFFIGNEEKDK